MDGASCKDHTDPISSTKGSICMCSKLNISSTLKSDPKVTWKLEKQRHASEKKDKRWKNKVGIAHR